jgi:hypothetical protein
MTIHSNLNRGKKSKEKSNFFKIIPFESPAKLFKEKWNRHFGQAKRDPGSRILKQFWIPASASDPIRDSPE